MKMIRVPTVGVLFCFLATAASAQELRDAFGDPLPKGAVARLGTTRWRNVNDQWQRARLEFSPDGRGIVCLMPDGSLTSFDADSGRELWRIRGPRSFFAFNFTPDGKTLITSDVGLPITKEIEPYGIRVWDVSNRRQTRFIESGVYGEISLRGNLMAAIPGGEAPVPIVNWRTGRVEQTLESKNG